jgi:hypothetical protein
MRAPDGARQRLAGALDFPAEHCTLLTRSRLLQELGLWQGAHVAGLADAKGPHERGGLRSTHPQEMLEVTAGQRIPVERLELADRVGQGEQPPWVKRHVSLAVVARAGPSG